MQSIGVIGTGTIGGTIATACVQHGHRVVVANSRGVEGVRHFASKCGAEPGTVADATRDSDIIILSVPQGAIASFPRDVWQGVGDDVIVVDTTNYYPGLKHDPIEAIEAGMVESLWVQEQIQHPVIKAFNMVLADTLAERGVPAGNTHRLAMFVAGDNEKHKGAVMSLVDDMGFDPIDNGLISDSWTQQPNSPGYCCDYTAQELLEVRSASSATKASVFANNKRFAEEFVRLAGGDFSHENVVRINRMLNR